MSAGRQRKHQLSLGALRGGHRISIMRIPQLERQRGSWLFGRALSSCWLSMYGVVEFAGFRGVATKLEGLATSRAACSERAALQAYVQWRMPAAHGHVRQPCEPLPRTRGAPGTSKFHRLQTAAIAVVPWCSRERVKGTRPRWATGVSIHKFRRAPPRQVEALDPPQ